MYYQTARDVHDLRERIARLETRLTPLATAAEQMAKEEAQQQIKDDAASTKSDNSHHAKLDDDWWCLFSRPDQPSKKCDWSVLNLWFNA